MVGWLGLVGCLGDWAVERLSAGVVGRLGYWVVGWLGGCGFTGWVASRPPAERMVEWLGGLLGGWAELIGCLGG